MTKRLCCGFGLTETLLTLGALSALSLGIYMVLAPASASATTKKEQDNLRDLSSAVERSWGLLGSYSGVSTARVEADGLAPTRMRADGRLRTSWGTAVDVVPHSVRESNDAFLVAYPLAPASVCARLASAVARSVYDVRVDGVSVFDGGKLNPSAAAAACGQRDAASMEFVYYSGLVAGSAVAASPLVMPPSSALPAHPSTPVTATPAGPVSPADPAAGVGAVQAAPPAPVVSTPAAPGAPGTAAPVSPLSPVVPPVSVAPPGNVAACQPRTDAAQRDVNTCPAVNWGSNTERRTQAWTCPEAWEAPVAGAWSSWSQTSSHCNACPGPVPQSQTRWIGASAGCPAGQSGVVTWEAEQVQTRTGTYNCPAGTAAQPGVSWGGWSAWSNTGARRSESNGCAPPPCAAPAPEHFPIAEARANQTQTLGCPAGQNGQITQARTVTEHGTHVRTWSCPGPTVSGANHWNGGHSFGEWQTIGNTCATAPVIPPPPTTGTWAYMEVFDNWQQQWSFMGGWTDVSFPSVDTPVADQNGPPGATCTPGQTWETMATCNDGSSMGMPPQPCRARFVCE